MSDQRSPLQSQKKAVSFDAGFKSLFSARLHRNIERRHLAPVCIDMNDGAIGFTYRSHRLYLARNKQYGQ